MKFQKTLGMSLMAVGVVLAFSLGFSPQVEPIVKPNLMKNAAAKGKYKIDSVHSSVVFKIGHLGVARFIGGFNDVSGTYSFDPNEPENSSFNIQVKTDSVDSNNERRDGHLKSPDFFNAVEFPVISFTSTKVKPGGNNIYRVAGELSLHGVTKSITVDLEFIDAKETAQGFKSGFETTFTIKRTDFGMDTYVAEGALGDEVELTVCLEGKRL